MAEKPTYSEDISRIYYMIEEASKIHATFSEYILEDLILKNLQNYE